MYQREMIGSIWDQLNYIDCAVFGGTGQNDICNNAGIFAYPTWVFDNNKIEGRLISSKELIEFSGCYFDIE